jgi:hypothetical protein
MRKEKEVECNKIKKKEINSLFLKVMTISVEIVTN